MMICHIQFSCIRYYNESGRLFSQLIRTWTVSSMTNRLYNRRNNAPLYTYWWLHVKWITNERAHIIVIIKRLETNGKYNTKCLFKRSENNKSIVIGEIIKEHVCIINRRTFSFKGNRSVTVYKSPSAQKQQTAKNIKKYKGLWDI